MYDFVRVKFSLQELPKESMKCEQPGQPYIMSFSQRFSQRFRDP